MTFGVVLWLIGLALFLFFLYALMKIASRADDQSWRMFKNGRDQ